MIYGKYEWSWLNTLHHLCEKYCQKRDWIGKKLDQNYMNPYKHVFPSHLPILTGIEEMLISHVRNVMKTFLLWKKWAIGFQVSSGKSSIEYTTHFWTSSSYFVWLTCNCCTEYQPNPSKWFQAIPGETTKYYSVAQLPSSTPSFLLQHFDQPWHNELPTRLWRWIRNIPPSFSSCL